MLPFQEAAETIEKPLQITYKVPNSQIEPELYSLIPFGWKAGAYETQKKIITMATAIASMTTLGNPNIHDDFYEKQQR